MTRADGNPARCIPWRGAGSDGRRATAASEGNGAEGRRFLAALGAGQMGETGGRDVDERDCLRGYGARVTSVAVGRRLDVADEVVMQDGTRRENDPVKRQARRGQRRLAEERHEVSIALSGLLGGEARGPRLLVLDLVGRERNEPLLKVAFACRLHQGRVSPVHLGSDEVVIEHHRVQRAIGQAA